MYSRSITSAEAAVARFYSGWIDANENPGDAYKSRLHMRSTYVTKVFAQTVERNAKLESDGTLTFDPVLCGSEVQGEPAFNQVFEEEGKARFVVQNVSPNGVINVYAIDSNGWRIDEIDCPSGSKSEE